MLKRVHSVFATPYFTLGHEDVAHDQVRAAILTCVARQRRWWKVRSCPVVKRAFEWIGPKPQNICIRGSAPTWKRASPTPSAPSSRSCRHAPRSHAKPCTRTCCVTNSHAGACTRARNEYARTRARTKVHDARENQLRASHATAASCHTS
eukprot:2914177-Pleurochrysis_carterae.AAC.3